MTTGSTCCQVIMESESEREREWVSEFGTDTSYQCSAAHCNDHIQFRIVSYIPLNPIRSKAYWSGLWSCQSGPTPSCRSVSLHTWSTWWLCLFGLTVRMATEWHKMNFMSVLEFGWTSFVLAGRLLVWREGPKGLPAFTIGRFGARVTQNGHAWRDLLSKKQDL